MKWFLLLPALFCCSCATWGSREATVLLPNGNRYVVTCQSDGQLKYKQGEVSIEVDNRGRPSFIEQVLGTAVLGIAGAAAPAKEKVMTP